MEKADRVQQSVNNSPTYLWRIPDTLARRQVGIHMLLSPGLDYLDPLDSGMGKHLVSIHLGNLVKLFQTENTNKSHKALVVSEIKRTGTGRAFLSQ